MLGQDALRAAVGREDVVACEPDDNTRISEIEPLPGRDPLWPGRRRNSIVEYKGSGTLNANHVVPEHIMPTTQWCPQPSRPPLVSASKFGEVRNMLPPEVRSQRRAEFAANRGYSQS